MSRFHSDVDAQQFIDRPRLIHLVHSRMFRVAFLGRGANAAHNGESARNANSNLVPTSALTGGPSLTPGERTLLLTPAAGTTDPLAYLVDRNIE